MSRIKAFSAASFWRWILAGILCSQTVGLSKGEPGSIDINVYPVLTELNVDSTYTINVLQKLPNRWHYFSLNNFINTDRRREISDQFKFYSEHNLRWQIAEDSPLDFTIQLNLRSGSDSERLRFGGRWRLSDTASMESFFDSINLSYSVDFHMIQFDHTPGDIWQMEHVFRKTFPDISDRVYLAGFIDHTFNEELPSNFPSAPIVGEFQLGVRMVDNWYAIAEYRINEYRRFNTTNMAFGVEYIFKW